MLKKLMSSIIIGSIVLSMVGCSSNEQPKEQVYIIKHIDSQGKETKEQVTKEQYDKEVEAAKEAGEEVTTETKTTKQEPKQPAAKQEVKHQSKPEVTKKEAAPEEVKQLHYKTIIFPIIGFPIFRDTILYNKFISVLNSIGIKKIDTTDAEFNTDYHEAVVSVPGNEENKNKVIECIETGYTYNDTVIRHAKVAVGS